MEASRPVMEDIRVVDKPEGEEGEEKKLPEAVEAAAEGRSLTAEQHVDALEWLLADEEEDDSGFTRTLELNIGTAGVKVWMTWVIRPVDRETLRALRESGNRRQRRAGQFREVDTDEASLRIIATATVEPDLVEAARRKGIEAPDPAFGPMEIIQHRFRRKPGLVDQVVGEIFDLSGYDEEDVREAKEVKAAGNS